MYITYICLSFFIYMSVVYVCLYENWNAQLKCKSKKCFYIASLDLQTENEGYREF